MQITYSPVDWFHVGLTAQRTLAFQTALDVQRGLLVSVSDSKWEFTTYIYNPIVTDRAWFLRLRQFFECESARPDESWKSLPLLHFY
jgi:hypothetical protein